MFISGFEQRPISAVIFDMNGVIVDDERIHQESWRRYCQRHGLNISEDEFKAKVFGRTEKDTFEYLYGRVITKDELARFSDERVDMAIQIYRPHISMVKGLSHLLDFLRDQNITTAIATSSRDRYASFILDDLNIRHYFKAIITADEIIRGKPDSEIYLKAATAISVNPSHCMAIEDSVSGLMSATGAKMLTVGIATTHSIDELHPSDVAVHDFKELLDLIAL